MARVRRFHRVAELARDPFRADDLEIRRASRAGAAPWEVGRRATAHHVLIDLGDDRIGGHRRVIGVPARAEEAGLLAGVIDEENGPSRPNGSAGHRFGDLED